MIAGISFIKFSNTFEPFIIYLFACDLTSTRMSAFNSTFIKFKILEGDDSLDKCSLIKKVNMFYG